MSRALSVQGRLASWTRASQILKLERRNWAKLSTLKLQRVYYVYCILPKYLNWSCFYKLLIYHISNIIPFILFMLLNRQFKLEGLRVNWRNVLMAWGMIQADIVLCVLLDALILTRFGVLRKLNAELANGRLAMFVTELQFRAIIAHHNVLIYNFCSLPFPRDASHNPSVQNLFSDCSNLACHLRPSSGCSFRRGCWDHWYHLMVSSNTG